MTKDQEDYLEALSTFIEQYENKADPEPKKKTPAHEILRYLCQENGMSGAAWDGCWRWTELWQHASCEENET